MFNKEPPCGPCGYVLAIPENYDILDVIYNFIPAMMDGNNAIKLDGIRDALELSGMRYTNTNVNKIMVYITYMLKSSRERVTNA